MLINYVAHIFGYLKQSKTEFFLWVLYSKWKEGNRKKPKTILRLTCSLPILGDSISAVEKRDFTEQTRTYYFL